MNLQKAHLQTQKQQRMDFPLLFVTGALVLFGLVLVYDASVVSGLKDFKDSYYYIRQQLIWVVLGLLSMVFFARFDYKKFKKYSFPLLVISLSAL